MSRRTTSKWLPYWSPVLRVLKDAADPLRNKEIYRRFEMTGEAKALLHEEKRDPEWVIRWVLWDMGELVKHVARGLWEITEAGRAYVDGVPIDPSELEDMD